MQSEIQSLIESDIRVLALESEIRAESAACELDLVREGDTVREEDTDPVDCVDTPTIL